MGRTGRLLCVPVVIHKSSQGQTWGGGRHGDQGERKEIPKMKVIECLPGLQGEKVRKRAVRGGTEAENSGNTSMFLCGICFSV